MAISLFHFNTENIEQISFLFVSRAIYENVDL